MCARAQIQPIEQREKKSNCVDCTKKKRRKKNGVLLLQRVRKKLDRMHVGPKKRKEMWSRLKRSAAHFFRLHSCTHKRVCVLVCMSATPCFSFSIIWFSYSFFHSAWIYSNLNFLPFFVLFRHCFFFSFVVLQERGNIGQFLLFFCPFCVCVCMQGVEFFPDVMRA